LTKQANSDLAIAYIRVSTDDQHLGPEAQRLDCENWCIRHEVTLHSVYTDQGVSGGKGLDSSGTALDLTKRPALMEAISQMREVGAGILLVAKRDRLARDAMLAAMIERLLAKTGAVVRSADGVAGGDTPADHFQAQILDAASEYERALIRARTVAALAVKKRKGEKTGGDLPFGWSAEADPAGTLLLVEDEREQWVMAYIETARRAGLSYAKIAKRLNAEGISCRGSRWHTTTVVRLYRRQVAKRLAPALVHARSG
jgi:DNA invertase Pin-like site-specific DNA recombinase